MTDEQDRQPTSADGGEGHDEAEQPMPEPHEPVNEQPAVPQVVAQITLGFMVDGAIEVNFINAKAPHMWAGAKLLDTIATRMWNDSRDQQVAMHVQQANEIAAAQRAIDEMKRKVRH